MASAEPRRRRGYDAVGEENRDERKKCCCLFPAICCSQGCTARRPFNLVVAVVLIANAVVIGFEADLGLLGTGGRNWQSVKVDLKLAGFHRDALVTAQNEVRQVLQADAQYKSQAYDSMQKQMAKNDVSMADIGAGGTNAMQAKTNDLSDDGAYTLVEYVFMAFYFLEWMCRLCDQGVFSTCCDGWMFIDTVILCAGGADLALPLAIKFNEALPIHLTPAMFYQILAILRLFRVTRVFRLFRVIPELRTLLWPFSAALGIIFKIAFLIFVVDYVCAVLLTALIGQQRSQWGADSHKIDLWFGSIGRSMETLVAIMTLNGWKQYSDVLTEVLPGVAVVPALVLYTMLCSLAVIGIVTGSICDGFAHDSRVLEEEQIKEVESHRALVQKALTNKLEDFGVEKEHHINRKELELCLERDWRILADLKMVDPDASVQKCLEHFDRLTQTGLDVKTNVKYNELAEAIVNQTGIAQSSALVDVKHQCRATRRESLENAKELKSNVAVRHRESIEITKNLSADQAKLQSCVRELHLSCNGLRQEFNGLFDKMMKIERREETDRKERQQACEALATSMVEMTTKVKTVLEEQQTGFAEQIEEVQRETAVASESVTEMKKTVSAMPKHLTAVTRELEIKVDAIATATKRLAESANIDLTGPSDDEIEAMKKDKLEQEEKAKEAKRNNAAKNIQCMTRQKLSRKKVANLKEVRTKAMAEAAAKGEQDWDMARTGKLPNRAAAKNVSFLPFTNVMDAVAALNSGAQACTGGVCMVESKAKKKFFLLWRKDKDVKAAEILKVDVTTLRKPEVGDAGKADPGK